METRNLSSNWLKLQKKNESKNGISKKKRKANAKTVTNVSKISSSSKKVTNKDQALKILDKVTQDLDSKTIGSSKVCKTATELALWAQDNDINKSDLEDAYNLSQKINNGLSIIPDNNISTSRKTDVGKFLAIDCEFVGIGPEGTESALARVSIVNFYGHTLLDVFVKPREKVTDWRTWVSGILPIHMKNAISFKKAQKLVSDLLVGRVLVGHAVNHDLDSLMLSHSGYLTRDTSKHPPFRKISNGKTPALKKLAKEFLNIDIQGGEHSSVEDARATMLLYRLHKKEFEKLHRAKYGNHNHNSNYNKSEKS
ncbi:hypothetical protein PACTADRAFT_39017 [Pachysolen tannophilus NRRL Y-2460]|uniref:RNA exonuclease 4 n=1 Tax=Pachysolen tannophilus NRRL Y-2460 TaxID=669874 RepID=A0A1E4TZ67_PACTA|nr:hypothetical protein PACTADRAFT_39017 [Pachysolen tannophilus NRRL Y-2460]